MVTKVCAIAECRELRFLGSYVPPIRASHVVTNAYLKEIDGKKHLLNDWLVLNTDNGKNLKSLINAGVSIETSIRGLGQLDEETKHVQEYDYLGTDAVGNPSAGTYAHSGKYEVKVESVSDDQARELKQLRTQVRTQMRTPEEIHKDLRS
jgi:hypothetical protein